MASPVLAPEAVTTPPPPLSCPRVRDRRDLPGA